MCCGCGGADSRARHCTGETNGPSLKWQMPPNCHCKERSDVGISGRHSQIVQAAMKTYRRNRFVRFIAALYGLQVPSRDSHVASLLGMTNRKTSPSYRQPVRAANASPGPAVRSPTARGWEPSCNSLFLIPPAWAGEWSGRSRDPSPPASSPPGYPHCGRARGCDSRCSGTAAHPAR